MRRLAWFFVFMMCASCAFAQEQKIPLPEPVTEGGKPLRQCLKERRSQREYDRRELSSQMLSDLLWCADGVNRSDGRRTAPSTMDAREIEIYVSRSDGLFLYEPAVNSLTRVLSEDIRAKTGLQPFVKDAAVNLIYVADESKMGKFGDKKELYAGADAAFIAQNVYLFCASEGLATVVRGAFDQKTLSQAMALPKGKRVVLTQSAGYPK